MKTSQYLVNTNKTTAVQLWRKYPYFGSSQTF